MFATGLIISPINPSKNLPESTAIIALLAPKKGVPNEINLSTLSLLLSSLK